MWVKFFPPPRRTINWPPFLLLLGWAVLIRPSCAVAQEVSQLQKRFMNEAPLQWKQYQHYAMTVQGGYSQDLQDLTGEKKVTRTIGWNWKQCNGSGIRVFDLSEKGKYQG